MQQHVKLKHEKKYDSDTMHQQTVKTKQCIVHLDDQKIRKNP